MEIPVIFDIARPFRQRMDASTSGGGSLCQLTPTAPKLANHSILWAIIHGIFGWLYVIYFALFRS